MMTRIIQSCHIIQFDQPVAVDIQLGISLQDQVLSELVDVTTNISQKLVKVDLSVTIPVESLDQFLSLIVSDSEAVVSQSVHELIRIHLMVSIIIQYSEDAAQPSDPIRSSLQQLRLDVFQQIVN